MQPIRPRPALPIGLVGAATNSFFGIRWRVVRRVLLILGLGLWLLFWRSSYGMMAAAFSVWYLTAPGLGMVLMLISAMSARRDRAEPPSH